MHIKSIIARINLIFMLTIASGLLLSGLVYAGPSHHLRRHAVVQMLRDPGGNVLRFQRVRQTLGQSANWSGYVLPKFETKQKYTSASATWVVPSVSFEDAPPGAGLELSSNWVGIGGYCKNAKCHAVDRKLIQLGTEQDVTSAGTPDYFAWYEVLPAFETPTSLVVHPGDLITASLTCAGKCKGRQSWTLAMNNLTTGGTWSVVVKYHASKLSTEWIEEAPSFSSGIQPLADFNTAAFSQSTVNGVAADLTTGDSLQLFNTAFGPTSNISAPDSTHDGFEACWGANQTFTPCFPQS